MDKLELYAREKEQEKEYLKQATILLMKAGHLDKQYLEYAIEKAFKLGHHAGHCRGEMHKDKLKKGAV
ncbi:hypothetical protein [Oceanobacillus caeni]|uniref:hypothetical protein n=1 Tax=Oceanobacillus caeni TaxID=405946 RepID=UPI00363033F2